MLCVVATNYSSGKEQSEFSDDIRPCKVRGLTKSRFRSSTRVYECGFAFQHFLRRFDAKNNILPFVCGHQLDSVPCTPQHYVIFGSNFEVFENGRFCPQIVFTNLYPTFILSALDSSGVPLGDLLQTFLPVVPFSFVRLYSFFPLGDLLQTFLPVAPFSFVLVYSFLWLGDLLQTFLPVVPFAFVRLYI
jgi:hypothetical protein